MRHTSKKVAQHVLEEYNELIQDTAHELNVHLQRIDEKMARFTLENTNVPSIQIDLNDEREVTKQCLRICEDAGTYLESLTTREQSLLREVPQNAAEEEVPKCFEAQLLTNQALGNNRDNLSEVIGLLQERLKALVSNKEPSNENERLRLQEDLNTSKQCIEVCNMASEVSRQKIYRVGEVIADGESDQVVVNTLADLFDVKKALSTGNSAQLVGSMTEESLRHLTEKRYGSRFGALASDFDRAPVGTPSPSSVFEAQTSHHAFPPQTSGDEQYPELKTSRNSRPSANGMRKRVPDKGLQSSTSSLMGCYTRD